MRRRAVLLFLVAVWPACTEDAPATQPGPVVVPTPSTIRACFGEIIAPYDRDQDLVLTEDHLGQCVRRP